MEKYLLLSLMILTGFARAGVISGGGGRGIACYNNAHEILNVELLDLWEGTAIWGYQYPNPQNLDDERRRIFPRISPQATEGSNVYNNMKVKYEELQQKMQFIPAGSRLTETDDGFVPVLPIGCELVQIAHYYESKYLLVDKEYWDLLNDRNKLALLIHEAKYKAMREFGWASDSTPTRKYIALLFSESSMSYSGPAYAPTQHSRLAGCSDFNDDPFEGFRSKLDFFLYVDCEVANQCKLKVDFNVINGFPTYLKTTGVLGIESGLHNVNNTYDNWILNQGLPMAQSELSQVFETLYGDYAVRLKQVPNSKGELDIQFKNVNDKPWSPQVRVQCGVWGS